MASDHVSAVRAIEGLYASTFAQDQTEGRISWEGVPFTPPSTGVWHRPRVLWGDSFMDTDATTARNTTVGVLTVSLFARPGSGKAALYTKADAVRDAFNRVTTSGVRFDAPSGPKPGTDRSNEGEWLQIVIDCPFTIEEESA